MEFYYKLFIPKPPELFGFGDGGDDTVLSFLQLFIYDNFAFGYNTAVRKVDFFFFLNYDIILLTSDSLTDYKYLMGTF